MGKETKSVKYLLPAVEVDMGGFLVKQPLPTKRIQQVDPFLLLHHANTKYNNKKLAKNQGIGPHPHRGFSPVTFVIEGEVWHRDSRGNNQIAKKGEVQWMHAGAGIVHSERPSQELVDKNGRQEIIQLWINSPSKKKRIPPEYYYLSSENMTTFTSNDGMVNNKLIAGNYENQKGKIIPQSELLIIWGEAQKNGIQKYLVPQGFNCLLYLIKGSLLLKGYGLIEKEHLAIFDKGGESIEISFDENSQFLLLAGKPIDEEVSQYGPYVMNTQTEIMEAMRDYQMGKMGILIEE